MDWHLHLLITDYFVWALVGLTLGFSIYASDKPHLYRAWKLILIKPLSMMALVIILFYFGVGLLDSIHLESQHKILVSLLDLITKNLYIGDQSTYSSPFFSFSKDHFKIFFNEILIVFLLLSILAFCFHRYAGFVAWKTGLVTLGIFIILVLMAMQFSGHYHLLGTDKVGSDLLYENLKSVRTGLIVGTLTTLFMLPFALLFGLLSGYCRGWIDDVIQYLYTTLSSIPGVLLISASILVLQMVIANHASWFPTLLDRADARLLALCFVLGITGWANLCRLLRGETLKLREQEYVQAAKIMGVSSFKILCRHIFPNVLHIVLITVVLDFSGLVLAEAVLSYVGVGVDPTTMSWGNMINSSRLELAREPVVWWPLCSAFVFMFLLVLSANILADTVRDGLDPRL